MYIKCMSYDTKPSDGENEVDYRNLRMCVCGIHCDYHHPISIMHWFI